MKLYVIVHQGAFIEIAKRKNIKVDANDAIIFRYIYDFATSNKTLKKLVDGKLYSWISYKKIIDDNPILNIENKDIIGRRINKLLDLGLINKYLSKEDGNKIFLNMTDLAFTIVETNLPTQKSEPLHTQKSEPLPTQKSDNSILNNRELGIERANNIKRLANIELNHLGSKARLNEFDIKELGVLFEDINNSKYKELKKKLIDGYKYFYEDEYKKNRDAKYIKTFMNYIVDYIAFATKPYSEEEVKYEFG